MDRDGLISALYQLNIQKIIVQRGKRLKRSRVDRARVVVGSENSNIINISNGAAEDECEIRAVGDNRLRVADMRTALLACMEQGRDYRESVLDRLLQPAGHSILFTPPYTPRFQPIERVSDSVSDEETDGDTSGLDDEDLYGSDLDESMDEAPAKRQRVTEIP